MVDKLSLGKLAHLDIKRPVPTLAMPRASRTQSVLGDSDTGSGKGRRFWFSFAIVFFPPPSAEYGAGQYCVADRTGERFASIERIQQ